MKTLLLLCVLLCIGCASDTCNLRVTKTQIVPYGSIDPTQTKAHAQIVSLKTRQTYKVAEGDTVEEGGRQFMVSSISQSNVVVESRITGEKFIVPILSTEEASEIGAQK